jgi:hypothetical protein
MSDETFDPELTEQLIERAIQEEPGARRRWVTPRERRFIDAYLGPAQGDVKMAAKLAGFDEANGYNLIQRPHVQAEIARLMEVARQRTGIDLSKERLLMELDNALMEVKAAFSKEVTAYGTCPICERRVTVTIQAGPKEIASLGMTISRTVETAARIVGALAPTKVEHTGKAAEAGTYHTLVRMIRENPKALNAAQRDEIIANARKDQADIAELLQLLNAGEVH